MTLEEDIEQFRLWATKLGCPPDAIPTDAALKSVFKSPQRDLFCNLMKRVLPRQEVQAVRENILIKKMEKLKDQVVPVCGRSFLPKEMQTFLKMKDLKKRKEEVELRLEEYKKEYDTLAASIKTKNIQSLNLEYKKETLQDKVILLEFKSEALDKELRQEEQIKENILAAMPVQLSAKNASEAVATDAVEDAFKHLETFYILCMNNNNQQILQEAKKELWQKMRSIFANIPNFMLFNAIMRLKEEQLQHIMILNKSKLQDSQLSCCSAAKEPLTTFEMKLMKTKADLLGIVAKYLAARHERLNLEERFSKAYIPFVDELQKKVNLFNADPEENVDEVISDYLVQYNLRNFSKSQNEFLVQQIECFKAEIEGGDKQLKNHEVMLGSIRQVYNDINASINRVQYEMLQLGQIKEKILYSKNMLKHIFDDLQVTASATDAKSNFLLPSVKINNMSIMGGAGDSFELGSDNVFCSTKLDFDSTMMTSLNNTAILPAAGNGNAAEGRCSIPTYLIELNTFSETPLECFNCMPKECAFYLSPNPLVVEWRVLSSTIQLAPGVLLTPFGALQEVRNRIVWADSIAEHSNDLKLDLELIMVDPLAFKQKVKKQRELIAELLDKIDVTSINTNRTLQKVAKCYDFVLENPLRHYIPDTKCFNNQTYSDFEAEFNMYYRMATVGSSIK